ncbi:hypothetical protein B0O99DRAFT_639508 [Bisporella sp. PMI_857]|nr:hypothetical protein B0O99DRAFT_639508 [Bisporella sp. PMI_857]
MLLTVNYKESLIDINTKDSGGQMPLSPAAGYRHEAVVKLLFESGQVEVDSKVSSC